MRLHLTLSVAVFLLCAMPMQFVVFKMVINTKMLSTVVVVLYTTITTAVLGLSAMSLEAELLEDISDKITNMTGSYP
jgi:predicted secreted protein